MFSSNTSQVSSGGYEIQRSLRFNSADSAYLNRTPASAGNRRTWTWSGWVKRGAFGSEQDIFGVRIDGDNQFRFYFTSSEKLDAYNQISGLIGVRLVTTQVFRDPSAWYHIVLAADTTNATAGNRLRMYVNGSEITAFDTDTQPSQNYDTQINTTNIHGLGFFSLATANLYMTEVNFIDGQALTPSSFGALDAQTGVWGPTRYAGSYGTNGFYLNFSDNSNTTAATLGRDYSGNSNNWTPNNFSVSAGAGNDSLVDVPTNWGTDTGVGGTVRGNYSTMNPLDTGALNSTLSDGNLKVVTEIGNFRYMGNTIWTSAGKFYAEFKITADSGYAQIGIAVRTTTTNKILGVDSDSWSYNGWNGSSGNNNSFPAYGSAFGTGDTIGIAVDRDTNKLYFSKNGVWQNSSDPAAGTGSLNISGISGIPAMIAVCDNDNAGSCTFEVNFGQRPFAYTAPSGFRALNTQNLPTPTIGATTATQAGKFFNAVTFTSPNGGAVVTGVGFQPDFTWEKGRSVAEVNALFDVLRGNNAYLISNSTAAEGTISNVWVPSSDGFTIPPGVLSSGQTYVAWNWKANGAGVTNTAGSVTTTVSANTTSGFSIARGTLPSGVGASYGHGLGVAPSFIIAKSTSSASDWFVYHSSLGFNQDIRLNTTAAASSTTFTYNSANASTVTIGGGNVNAFWGANTTWVWYNFAEVPGYSKFGSYTGNGSSDGPFCFTGMRPAYVLVKCSSTSENWHVLDNKRNTANSETQVLFPNLSNAEVTGASGLFADFTANGFKIRENGSAFNTNGQTYIFAAFAETPFKYSLGR